MKSCTPIRSLVPAMACVASVLSASALAAPAVNDDDGTRSLAVRYTYADLSTVTGATRLYRSIEAAAHVVCGEPGRRMDERSDWKHCYRNALSEAVAEVNSPLLTAIHRQQRGEAAETAMLRR